MKRYVDGKTLKQIEAETGISYKTLAYRYVRGDRTMESITRPVMHNHNDENRLDMCTDKGRRFLQAVMQKNMTLKRVYELSGVDKGTIYAFMYENTDISSMRLAKICGVVGVSMDYVMGLRRSNE